MLYLYYVLYTRLKNTDYTIYCGQFKKFKKIRPFAWYFIIIKSVTTRPNVYQFKTLCSTWSSLYYVPRYAQTRYYNDIMIATTTVCCFWNVKTAKIWIYWVSSVNRFSIDCHVSVRQPPVSYKYNNNIITYK